MSYLTGNYITPEGLEAIKKHKYKSGEYTAIENALNHYWNFVSDLCPRSLAPNTITLLGGIIVAVGVSLMLYYDMSMTQPLPSWTYLVMGLGLWIFQTLDAIDGKQARKTDSSTPLGQLFDHGLDAITWCICALSVVISLQLGMSMSAMITMFSVMAPFFLTNILEHYSGVFEYSVGAIGGTNGLILMTMFNLIPFFAGPKIYDNAIKNTLPFLPSIITREFLIRDAIMAIICFCAIQYTLCMTVFCLTSVKGIGYKVRVTLQMLQSYGVFVIMYMLNDNIKFVHDNAGWFYASIILLFSIISTKLIVCNMASMYYTWIHLEYLVFGIYFYFQYNYEPTPEHDLKLKCSFIATFVILLLLYLRLVQGCINQLTEYLGIYCFSIEKKPEKSKLK